MSFEFFDPDGEVRISAGNLPHWYQPGVTYFITFRTEDSLPRTVAEQWYRRRHEWLRQHGIVAGTLRVPMPSITEALRTLPVLQQHQFHRTFSREFMEHLDKGYGACVLKRPDLAKAVADALKHFDGRRYHLGDYVVMPNHVHVLVCLLGDTDLEEQCYSWKKYTATKINRTLAQKGRFWQEESFDHLVRTPEQFEYLRLYIADNPKKAELHPGEYLHWRRP
jgi:type I restriction enzyme R subunit